jgi:hypothetical protein
LERREGMGIEKTLGKRVFQSSPKLSIIVIVGIPLPVLNYFITLILQRQNNLKIQLVARYQWLTSIILATREAEIRRIVVQGQPWQKEDPI